jgi:hypothetical protein
MMPGYTVYFLDAQGNRCDEYLTYCKDPNQAVREACLKMHLMNSTFAEVTRCSVDPIPEEMPNSKTEPKKSKAKKEMEILLGGTDDLQMQIFQD